MTALDAPSEVASTRPKLGRQTVRSSIVWRALREQRRWLILLLVATTVYVLALLESAVTIKNVFDEALTDPSTAAGTVRLHQLVGALVVIGIVACASGLVTRMTAARIVAHLEYQLRVWLYDRLLALDPRRLDGMPLGQVVTRALTDLTFLEGLMAVLPIVLIAVGAGVAIAIALVVISPVIGLLSLVTLPINLAFLRRLGRRLYPLSWLALDRRAEVTSSIDESVRGIRVVKAFAAEEAARTRVGAAALTAFSVAQMRIKVLARYGLPMKAIPGVFTALALAYGAHEAVDGSLQIGTLVLCLGFATLFTGLATQLDDITSLTVLAGTGSGRIFDLVGSASADDDSTGGPLPAPTGHGLVLRGVVGPLDAPVVVPDLAVPPGRWVGVQAGRGVSSTLLARLASGDLVPSAGTVELDQVELGALAPSARRAGVRLLTAEAFLFGRSVRENLLLGAGGVAVSDEVLHAALAAAGAAEFVAELGGLDGAVGDRGLTLSGGQRQRLALARAIVVAPRVLVLDDALGAVNPGLELEILRAVRRHATTTAVLLTTSRPGPLGLADEVHTTCAAVVEVLGVREEPGEPPPPMDVPAIVLLDPPVPAAAALDDSRPPSMLTILGPLRAWVAAAAACLLVATVAGLAPAALIEVAVDAIRRHDARPGYRMALLIVPLGVLVSVATYGLRRSLTIVDEGVLYLLRRRTFQRLTRLGVDFYDRELPGQVASRVVYDLDRITDFIDSGVNQLATSVALLVTANAFLWFKDVRVFEVVAPLLPIAVVLTVIQTPLASAAYARARTRLGAVVERLHEDVAGRDVLVGPAREESRRQFGSRSWDLRSARLRAAWIGNLYLAGIELGTGLTTAAMIDRAGSLALRGAITLGSVVFFQVVLNQALAPIPQLSAVVQSYLVARASFHALGQPYGAPLLPVPDATAGADCPPLRGALAIEAVTFAYPGVARPALHDVHVRVGEREVVAVVGPTGAGKSSVAKLVGRVYDPDAGRVSVDGIDLRTVSVASYRRRIGVVPQDAFCFRGTVGSNVRFGRPDATDDQVVAALHACGATDLLASLPHGIDTHVDEEGRSLGPIGRQWVALARAWLIDPGLLVLDEATSSLPDEDEQRVLDAVRARGRATLVVTHRREAAERCDRVLVVDDGRIVAADTPAALTTNPAYAALWA